MKDETISIRTQAERTENREHSVPLYLTSSYVFEDAEDMRARFAEEKSGPLYSRYSNPNTDEFIEKMKLLEGAEDGFATATGMSAVFTTLMGLLEAGDHIVASRAVFGSTHQLFTLVLPKYGITTSYVDGNEGDWDAAFTDKTKLVFIETPSNPGLEILDIQRISDCAKKHGAQVVIDNCFATPIIQKPIALGADVVIHSATKYIDGQGRVLGGVILCSAENMTKIRYFARHSGPAMSPFNAWVLSKSLETFALRVERHSENAAHVAELLEKHEKVGRVIYPFLESHPNYDLAKKQMKYGGGIVSFELKGGLEAGRKFLDNSGWFSLSANLGDTRTIATHPASTTHAKLAPEERQQVGITDGLVRLSVGLENRNDLVDQLIKTLSNV